MGLLRLGESEPKQGVRILVRDTRWRLILCWGTVITFLLMPLSLLILGFVNPVFAEEVKNYKFMGKFFESVTALVFGLAGLRSVDKYVETKNGNGNKKPPS
jgi:hypothetical protein